MPSSVMMALLHVCPARLICDVCGLSIISVAFEEVVLLFALVLVQSDL